MSSDAFPMDCDHCLDAGPYVLRALDEHEATAFATHLDRCATCRDQVRVLQGTADTLPLAAPSVVPPREIKGRLMAIVQSEAQLLQAAGPEADRRPRREPVATGWRSRMPRLGRLVLRPPVAAGLACGLLAMGTGVGLLFDPSGTDGPATRTLEAPVTLANANAKLIVTGSKGTLHLVGMPQAPAGQTYQVWLRRKGTTKVVPSRTLFGVRPDGNANVPIEESVKGVDQVLVTAERSGGSNTPSRILISATPS